MSVPKDRPQPGPGAPLTAEREQYRRLMAQGLNNHQACLLIGVNPTTGSRWSKGRNMVDHTGKARYYPPVHAEPKAISARYLSEEERVLIGDLLAAGYSQRSVAAQLRRSPSTISGGGSPQHQRRGELPAVRGAPQSAGQPAPAEIGQTGPRPATTRLRAGPPGAAVEPAADLPRTADRVPRPTGEAFGARNDLPGPLRAPDAVNCDGSWPGRCGPGGPDGSRTAAATPAARATSSTHR